MTGRQNQTEVSSGFERMSRDLLIVVSLFMRLLHKPPTHVYNLKHVESPVANWNFRFGFRQPHTILEFLFFKPEGLIKASWAAVCLFRIAHVGRKLLRSPDLPLAQPTPRTPLRLLPPFCRIYFPSFSVTLPVAAAPQSAAPCSQRAAA